MIRNAPEASPASHDSDLIAKWIVSDPLRWQLLGHVRSLDLPDCWIAAGFVRDAVWAHLHGQSPGLKGDVDVIWFDRREISEERDRDIEDRLRKLAPGVAWSVKNQARMHIANGDAPYASSADAMRYWPETATAVAIRRTAGDTGEVTAPLGLDDLFSLKLRPAGEFKDAKRAIFEGRLRTKKWLERFPLLALAD